MTLLKIFLVSGVLLTLISCASNTPQSSTRIVGETSPGFNPARSPASLSWSTDSKTVTIQPGGLSTELTLRPTQEESYIESYLYSCDVWTLGEKTCYDYTCSGGTGSSELWNAYYGAKKDQKANALNEAILGIGTSSARSLHASGVFNSKPRSWKEFQEKMSQALKSGYITQQQYQEVFGTYAEQNRINLGYAGTSCTQVPYRCIDWGYFWVTNGCEGTRRQYRTVQTQTRTVRLQITNPLLQSFETEDIVITAGPKPESIQVSQTPYTEYSMTQSTDASGMISTVQLTGVRRIQSALPAGVFKGITFRDAKGANFIIGVTVDSKYLGRDQDKLMVHLKVTSCKTGLFGCKNKTETTKTIDQALTAAATDIEVSGITPGYRIWVEYSFSRENSTYYHNTPTRADSVKVRDYKK